MRMRNPMQWNGYGARLWGLTACDGPADVTRQGRRHASRDVPHLCGARRPGEFDDGTIAPTAAGGSIAVRAASCASTR